MGITVILETESGAPLATVEDPTNVLHRLLPEIEKPGYPHLSSIDSYGDTVFNRLQAPSLLAEWERLDAEAGVLSVEERRVLDGIRELAERLKDEVHVYLKFYGD
jgi:hypothetical protein